MSLHKDQVDTMQKQYKDKTKQKQINILCIYLFIITLWCNKVPRVCEQPVFTAQQNYNYYIYTVTIS